MAEKAIENGANMVIVDVLTAGFSALEVLSRNVNVRVHVHRTMHGAFSRDKGHGISMLVLSNWSNWPEALICMLEAMWKDGPERPWRMIFSGTLCMMNGLA